MCARVGSVLCFRSNTFAKYMSRAHTFVDLRGDMPNGLVEIMRDLTAEYEELGLEDEEDDEDEEDRSN